MRICLAVYSHRLAALFDNASRLLIYLAEADGPRQTGVIDPPMPGAASRMAAVMACGADVLICGALSRCSRRILTDSGLIVWDWVRGDIDAVLTAWQENRLQDMTMPGCWRQTPCCQRQTQNKTR